jgi:hypothetical protein
MSARICTLLSLATASLLPLLQVGCTQPDVNCTSAHGKFAARFERKSGDANQPCGQQVGDVLGMSTYYATGGINGTPKFDEPSVAIRAQYMYKYIYGVRAPKSVFDTRKLDMEVGDPDAFGAFEGGVPDDEGFCAVPSVSKVSLTLPEVQPTPDDPATPDKDETDPGQVAADLAYEWSNVKFLVTADAQGTQFSADLKFTQDACTATYHVVGVYPATDCTGDPTICDDDANGINPSFPTECMAFSESESYCVLKGEPPAYDPA